MKDRCNNPNCNRYQIYGGRGIKYDPKWESFTEFWKDMGESYNEELTLERVDNNGGYNKDNCRWATVKEQSNNRRNNRFIEIDGVTKTLSQWSDDAGIRYGTLVQRINVYKWPIKKALEYEVV